MPDVVHIPSPTGVVIAADHWEGAGRPVVLAHGGGQTRYSWGGTAQALADAGHRVVSMDLRGHGDSTWAPDHDYTMTSFRDDALAVADWVAEPPTWVGASLGGMSGLHAVDERPTAFRALVLVDITPHPAKQGVDKILGFMGANAEDGFATLDEAADAIAAYQPHRTRPKDLSGLAKNLRLGDDGRWRWHWDPRFLEGNRRIGAGSREVEQALVAAAKSVTIPALLVRGGSSELVQEEHAKDFVKLVPHATYVDVSGARHMVAGDRNDQFANAIEVFLRTVA